MNILKKSQECTCPVAKFEESKQIFLFNFCPIKTSRKNIEIHR